jgi:limonene-1,2-epoxide hydrolase
VQAVRVRQRERREVTGQPGPESPEQSCRPGWPFFLTARPGRILSGQRYPVSQRTFFGDITLRPRQLVRAFVEAFNRADADALASLYAEDAINYQVAESPVEGREAIRRMFVASFASAKMTCIVENLSGDGERAILEWKDPPGLRGCGFFHVVDGRIVFQRGYRDKFSFLRVQGLPLDRDP